MSLLDKILITTISVGAIFASFPTTAINLEAVAPDATAINMLGFSHHFGEDEKIVTENQSDMIGFEYCIKDGRNSSSLHCTAITHYTDPLGKSSTATTYHWRRPWKILPNYVTYGVLFGHVPNYEPPLVLAPELILHIDGAGLRIFCAPGEPAVCMTNLHISF